MNVCQDIDHGESSTDFDKGLRLETRRAEFGRFNERRCRSHSAKVGTIRNRDFASWESEWLPTILPCGNIRVVASGTHYGEPVEGTQIVTVEFGEITNSGASGDLGVWWKSAISDQNSTVFPTDDVWSLVVDDSEGDSEVIDAEAFHDHRFGDRVRLPNRNIPFAKWEEFDEPEWDPDRFRAQLAVNEFYGGEDADSDTP